MRSGERWKSIEGYEGIYSISNWGNVRNDRTGKFISLFGDRHFFADLWVDNKKDRKSVHRLVAIAFVPNPSNQPNVLHDNGNGFDNYYKNLKWGTQVENLQDAMRHGTWFKPPLLRGSKNGNSKITEKEAKKIKYLLKNSGLSQQAIGNLVGVTRSLVRDIKLGNSWKHL